MVHGTGGAAYPCRLRCDAYAFQQSCHDTTPAEICTHTILLSTFAGMWLEALERSNQAVSAYN